MISLTAITDFFGEPFEVAGDEIRFNCPWCRYTQKPDTKGHLYVNFGKGVYHCFRCGESGSLFSIFPQATQRELRDIAVALGAVEEEHLLAHFDGFYPPGVSPLTDPSHPAAEYLMKRGLSWKEIQQLRFGLDPSWEGYVVLPFYMGGNLTYWQGRDYLDRSVPKYMNPSVPKAPFVSLLDDTSEECWLVEGAFDAIFSRVPSMALLGSFLSRSWLRYPCMNGGSLRRYIVALDADAFGKALKVCNLLLVGGGDKEVYLARWPHWLKDPGELGPSGKSLRDVATLELVDRETLLRFYLQRLRVGVGQSGGVYGA